MTQQQINSLNMFRAVISLMEKRSDVWNTRMPVVPVVNNLKSVIAGIEQYMKNQLEKDTSGYTQQKDAKLDVLVRLTYRLLTKLRAFAKATQNSVLLNAVNYSPSSLESGSETDIISRCRSIAAKGLEYLGQMLDYEVSLSEIQGVINAADEVTPLASHRDTIASERKAATASIPELIRKGKDQLSVLDDLIDGMISDRDFVNTYFNARAIIDRSTAGATAATTK